MPSGTVIRPLLLSTISVSLPPWPKTLICWIVARRTRVEDRRDELTKTSSSSGLAGVAHQADHVVLVDVVLVAADRQHGRVVDHLGHVFHDPGAASHRAHDENVVHGVVGHVPDRPLGRS